MDDANGLTGRWKWCAEKQDVGNWKVGQLLLFHSSHTPRAGRLEQPDNGEFAAPEVWATRAYT
jgi:hypothetical protein